ncbi:MAG: DUF4298 domain-containing protein [Anaerotignum sp.]|nr:DUF4298 domain-containing protein [Anaerotignum sp.]MBR6542942.1 DUF4298 domain-containing protein [Anaerotignum sp.]
MKEMMIQRIEQMEKIFDKVQNGIAENNVSIEEMVLELKIYYESGLWLSDYEADERGELPVGLKRGVLSQDGLYNLLCEWDERK